MRMIAVTKLICTRLGRSTILQERREIDIHTEAAALETNIVSPEA